MGKRAYHRLNLKIRKPARVPLRPGKTVTINGEACKLVRLVRIDDGGDERWIVDFLDGTSAVRVVASGEN